LLNDAIAAGESVMFEGAQGTMLDIDHGTYPFVTSSSATSGGAVTGTGVAPNAIRSVIGVTKAYCTRVGEGPFPTEIKDEIGDTLRARGNEYGAVTGRPRRCGWVDLPLLRYATSINGIDWMVVTKLDVLDTLDEVPVCVSYKFRGKKHDQRIPASAGTFEKVECIYEKIPGWKKPTVGIREFSKLPQKAQSYMKYLEEKTGARIGMISTGPDRDQTIMMDEFAAALQMREKSALRA
jgi:adenylosuccinate synthase